MVASTIDATGERKFDGITSVLRADLEQSSQFNIWDNQRLETVLRSMRRETLANPEPKDWRQIAVREKASLLVLSTVSPLADGFSLAISAEQMAPGTETPLQSWKNSWQTTGPEGLFEAEHEAAKWIRSKAGESNASVAASSLNPQSITSASWDAIGSYEAAQKASMGGRPDEAIALFRRAVQMDPQFALALMRLGDMLNAQYESEEGFGYWRQAIGLAHSQHLSERESLNIESRYALEVRDFKAAQPVLLDWTRKFPNDLLPRQLLATCLSAMGRHEEAIRLARETQEKFGPTVFGSATLIRALAARNQIAETEPEIRVLERLGEPALALQFRAVIAAAQGQYDAATLLFEKLVRTSQGQNRSRAVGWLAILKADAGKLDDARKLLREAIDADREAGEEGYSSQKMVALAFLEGLAGNAKLSRALSLQAAAMTTSPQIIVEAVTILARHGYTEDAARTMKLFPGGKGPRFEVASARMRGEILAASGKLKPAVDAMELAARTDQGHGPREYLARVLFLSGERERAELLYQNIAGSPWMIWGSPEDEWPGAFLAKKHQEQIKGE
jgi:tetratricopeptide (TPR) repeat protein